MKKSTTNDRHIALLRGINVGGHNKVPMAVLRELATGLGWDRVETYVQSGNVVFGASGSAAALEQKLEAAIEARLGLAVPVIVRRGAQWLDYAAASPFPAAESERPNLLHLGLSKRRPATGAAQALAKYCTAGESLELRGDAIWIDFPAGVARSKLTTAVLDRVIGSAVTMRNWKTAQQLAAMIRMHDR